MDEATVAYLQLLQNTIARMGQNSFILKGWGATLAAAVFALVANQSHPLFILTALVPTVVFWGLDAYYLRQERLFRALYRTAVDAGNARQSPSFSMDTTAAQAGVHGWFRTCVSPTVLIFYAAISALTVAISLGIDATVSK